MVTYLYIILGYSRYPSKENRCILAENLLIPRLLFCSFFGFVYFVLFCFVFVRTSKFFVPNTNIFTGIFHVFFTCTTKKHWIFWNSQWKIGKALDPYLFKGGHIISGIAHYDISYPKYQNPNPISRWFTFFALPKYTESLFNSRCCYNKTPQCLNEIWITFTRTVSRKSAKLFLRKFCHAMYTLDTCTASLHSNAWELSIDVCISYSMIRLLRCWHSFLVKQLPCFTV